jgi:hypothetical protein
VLAGLGWPALFFHPFHLVAVILDLAIVALAWGRLAAS